MEISKAVLFPSQASLNYAYQQVRRQFTKLHPNHVEYPEARRAFRSLYSALHTVNRTPRSYGVKAKRVEGLLNQNVSNLKPGRIRKNRLSQKGVML